LFFEKLSATFAGQLTYPLLDMLNEMENELLNENKNYDESERW
jgi:hypothetical protein